MSEAKITPEPWQVDVVLYEDEVKKTANVYKMSGEFKVSDFICTSNYEHSHLIAAAPELYEALYRLVRDCEIAGLQEQAGFDCWINMANKALAKARGEGEL
ncbi:hypothetical protein ACFQ3K_14700 [Brucella gallinifaecis]|uniref:Uncharacterized protein n=1 Tax=Brucella gallinifaecis TaxID=215590 RepID=A0A502BUR2_9HYPH|nr:hypothetical protein [Brucella gallinifaecis]TPF76713.1 hypothetical protein FHY56_04260 [Brucella gallinifaecis]